MPLVAGYRLNSYEIVPLLGAGGMGEVYRARDFVLKRDVAIKVLPADWSRDPDRLRRFELEARVPLPSSIIPILSPSSTSAVTRIAVTKDGRIKILDFGLARLEPAKAAGADGATFSTGPESSPGGVLRTIGYMSPGIYASNLRVRTGLVLCSWIRRKQMCRPSTIGKRVIHLGGCIGCNRHHGSSTGKYTLQRALKRRSTR